jgi:hypothetical protein
MKNLATLPSHLTIGQFARQRSPGFQFAYLAFGNAFLLAALFLFTSGFLSSALSPNDVSVPTALEHRTPETQDDAPFSRVVFLLVDALRSDFVYGKHSGFDFTQRHGPCNMALVFLLSLILTALSAMEQLFHSQHTSHHPQ